MLSARAYSFHQKSKLAISLSWIGGYVNVVSLLTCGWVASHMTGPTTYFGLSIVEGRAQAGNYLRPTMFFGFVIFTFWLGSIISAMMTESAERGGRPSKYILPMAVEAVLLSLFAIGINLNSRTSIQSSRLEYVMIGVAALAMGLQNATVTRISGAVVRTTHVTGVITDLGLEGVQWLYWFLIRRRDEAGGGRGGC